MGKFISLALGMLLCIGVFAWADGSGVSPGPLPMGGEGGEVVMEEDDGTPLSVVDQDDPEGWIVLDEEVEIGEVEDPPFMPPFDPPPFTKPETIRTYVAGSTETGYELRRANAGTGAGVDIIRFYQCVQCHTPPSAIKNVWIETNETYNPPPPDGDGKKVETELRRGTW